jgi:hypothetical protein
VPFVPNIPLFCFSFFPPLLVLLPGGFDGEDAVGVLYFVIQMLYDVNRMVFCGDFFGSKITDFIF